MMVHPLRTNPQSRIAARVTARASESPRWVPKEGRLRLVESSSQSGFVRDRGRIDASQPEMAWRRSLLCVDDDHEGATLIAEALSDHGYAVELAADGEIGLAKILAKRPDLVLCDLWMPRMSGLELLQKLTEAGQEFANLPFVFLTGRHDRDSELAARRLGADDYLSKPVDFEMLEAVVENRLRRGNGRSTLKPRVHLTEREKEVLTWVGRGKTSAEIAIILGLSERTVNFHCDQAMKRLDVINRTQAVATAMAQGLLSI